jgi:hypothetical protein
MSVAVMPTTYLVKLKVIAGSGIGSIHAIPRPSRRGGSNHETRNDRVDGIVGVFSPGSYRQRHGDEPVPHPASGPTDPLPPKPFSSTVTRAP